MIYLEKLGWAGRCSISQARRELRGDEKPMNWLDNPWVVSIGSAILIRTAVALVSRINRWRKDRANYIQEVKSANREIIYSLRESKSGLEVYRSRMITVASILFGIVLALMIAIIMHLKGFSSEPNEPITPLLLPTIVAIFGTILMTFLTISWPEYRCPVLKRSSTRSTADSLSKSRNYS